MRLEADEPVSHSFGSLYPPNTQRTLHGLVFSGQWSHTKLVYVNLRSIGTCDDSMCSTVYVEAIP